MRLGNIHDMTTVIPLFPTAARTSTANGTGADIKDYTGKVKVILDSAAGTGTAPTLDVKLQESDDNTTFTDITGATFTQVTGAAASLQSIGFEVDARKRYIRAVATIGGTTPSFTSSVNAIGMKAVQ